MKRRKFVASFRGRHGRMTSIGRDSLLWLCDALALRTSRLWLDDSGVLWMHERGNTSPVIVRIESHEANLDHDAIKTIIATQNIFTRGAT